MEKPRNTALDDAAATKMLTQAATTAARAPSIHNTQPWRWRIHGTVADLYADRGRWLRVGDPDRRMLTISCGAALHHARVALAATGAAIEVDLLPTASDNDHLARITVTGAHPCHRRCARALRRDRRTPH